MHKTANAPFSSSPLVMATVIYLTRNVNPKQVVSEVSRFDFLATAMSEINSGVQTTDRDMKGKKKAPHRPRKRMKEASELSSLAHHTEEAGRHIADEQQTFRSLADAEAGGSILEGEDEDYD